jgi:hypothetical protein
MPLHADGPEPPRERENAPSHGRVSFLRAGATDADIKEFLGWLNEGMPDPATDSYECRNGFLRDLTDVVAVDVAY